MNTDKIKLLLEALKVSNLDVDYDFRESVKRELASELGLSAEASK